MAGDREMEAGLAPRWAVRPLAGLGRWLLAAAGGALLVSPAAAFNFDTSVLTKGQEAVKKTQEAVSTTEQAISTGREAINTGQEMLSTGRELMNKAGKGGTPRFASDEGGVNRVVAVVGDGLTARSRPSGGYVSLLDRGTYYVDRQSAFVANAQGQVLATLRPDASTFAMDLPAVPGGVLHDLGSKGKKATRGVRIFALYAHAEVPQRKDRRFLDGIDQHGSVWASSVQGEPPEEAEDISEPVGGKLIVYASDTGVSFPSSFGRDGKLFTADDSLVTLPKGYTVVTLDRRGFTFERAREVVIPLHEIQAPREIDFSRLSWSEAFQAFCSLMSERYPYGAIRALDWTQIRQEYASRVAKAADDQNAAAYAQIYQEIAKRLRDSQFRLQLPPPDPNARRGAQPLLDIGLAPAMNQRGDYLLPVPRTWMSAEGKVFVSDVAPNSIAAKAGLMAGAEILEVDGEPVAAYVERMAAESTRATEAGRRAEALEFRLPPRGSLRMTVQQGGRDKSIELSVPRDAVTAAADRRPGESLAAFRLRSAQGSEYGYIAFNSFADAEGKLELWERHLAALGQTRTSGLIVDLRGNNDGNYQLVSRFLASFFAPTAPFRPTQYIQRQFDPSSRGWRHTGGLGLPPDLPMHAASRDSHYAGRVLVLTGRDCVGACEVFAFWLQQSGRAQVVASEPTAGGVGAVAKVRMPAGMAIQVPRVAEMTSYGAYYLEGKGVQPNVPVAINREFVDSLAGGGDPVLDAAVRWLDRNPQATPPAVPTVQRAQVGSNKRSAGRI